MIDLDVRVFLMRATHSEYNCSGIFRTTNVTLNGVTITQKVTCQRGLGTMCYEPRN